MPLTAGSSPSVRIIVSGSPAARPSACPGEPAASSPASWTEVLPWQAAQIAAVFGIPPDQLADMPADCYSMLVAAGVRIFIPPPLAEIPDGTMLAVAAVPGKILEEWRHAAPGAWMAWPHAADAVHAEEMTAAQLRAILAARDGCS